MEESNFLNLTFKDSKNFFNTTALKSVSINILTIFGIKYFMYNNLISSTDSYIELYMIYNVNKYIKSTDCKKNCKITMQCYGDGKPPGWQIIKSRWDNGIVKYKPSINKKLDTFFNS